jgi:predicted  nucleic acid-binding Zn-ribbon protein
MRLQAIDRERLAHIEDNVGRIHTEARAEAHAEFKRALAEQERAFEAWFAASERRVEASEARAQTLEAELIELRSQARDSAVKMMDDLRRCEADVVKADKAVANLRVEVGDKISALRERMVDAVESRLFSIRAPSRPGSPCL